MLLNLSPLARYRDYRFLFIGQLVSALGSMMTIVALPYQLYHLTGSSLAVGLVGIAELAPLLFTALVGGAYADSMDRRRLLIFSEIALAICSAALAFNSLSAHPQIWLIYVAAALSSGFNGFHRPSYSAMIPRLVDSNDIPATSSLNSMSGTVSAVAGPAIAGILIASASLTAAYVADVASFGISLLALWAMRPMPVSAKSRPASVSSIVEGLKYARSREELIGTYAVDFVAVVFGMPAALFPAVADHFGGAAVVGWLYSAPSAGAFLVSLFSGLTSRVERHGAAVILAATCWGFAVIAFGASSYSTHLWLAVFFLMLAGGADMVSAIFRNTIWNTTIPDHLRGRLAGVEMVSYMSGPLLGNAESGLVAALANTQLSIVSGGVLCVVGVALCALRLPGFWRYDYRAFRLSSASDLSSAAPGAPPRPPSAS